VANKAFGFSPTYTLWGISYQVLNSMFVESTYRNQESKWQKDELGEFEWIELESFEGGMRKVKKYRDPRVL